MSLTTATTSLLTHLGRPMTLRRRVGTSATFTDAVVQGYATTYRPDEVAGLVRQGDMKVVIGPDTGAVSAPIKAPDMLVMDGRTYAVQGATPRMVAGVVSGYELWVRGG